MQMNEQYAHLLKIGQGESIIEQNRVSYTPDFYRFMEEMIREHHIKRSEIARQSGLSQDYLYKLLRGDKHTNERDYILAICIVIGMNLPQTQHALTCYGMQPLVDTDSRSHLIMLALQDSWSFYKLNEALETNGFPYIRTSTDMEHAEIHNTAVEIQQVSPVVPVVGKIKRSFEEISSFVDAAHNGGNAPFDYDYWGEIAVQDDAGNIYHVEASFQSESCCFLVLTDEQHKIADEEMKRNEKYEQSFADVYNAQYDRLMELLSSDDVSPDNPEVLKLSKQLDKLASKISYSVEPLEMYSSLLDACDSEFFSFFLELDKRTDKKVVEVLSKLDDTRNYGSRVGSAWHGSEQPKIYIESFNDKQPELREYFQIVEYRDGTCRYTATHESCFLRMEMGKEWYELIFGEHREPEYYIDTPENEFEGNMSSVRYKFIFNNLLFQLHQVIKQQGGFVEIDDSKLAREEFSVAVETAMGLIHKDQLEEAYPILLQANDLLQEVKAPASEILVLRIHHLWKLFMFSGRLGLQDESAKWEKQLLDLLPSALQSEKELGDEAPDLFSVFASVYMGHYRESHNADYDEAYEYIKKAANLVLNHHAFEGENQEADLFEFYQAYAFHLDSDEDQIDKAIEYYEKAIWIANQANLVNDPHVAPAVACTYNNYAWVLWNIEGSEEAVIYYGRAIEIFEMLLDRHQVTQEHATKQILHFANALNKIYQDRTRPKESERLKKRLLKHNIVLTEE